MACCTLCARVGRQREADPGYRRCGLCRLETRLMVAQWRERNRTQRPLSQTRNAIYARRYRRKKHV